MRSSNRSMKSPRILPALAMALLAACTPAAMHRPESVLEKDDFTLTFIEFDDHGEPWAPTQLERTVQVIDDAHGDGKRTVVVLFVHGWHNDASKREDRKADNNVEGFQRFLQTTRELIDRADEDPEQVELIGVYLSWRGRSTDVGLLKPLTFYSRRGAGQRAASVSTTEAILRVMNAAKTNPLSTGVVIGHSFGGMIVESALIQAVVGFSLDSGLEIRSETPDLLILINPASQSMQAKNLVSMLKRNRLKFYRENADGNRTEAPFITSVTSTRDTATGSLYPMALSLKAWSKKFREYSSTDCSPVQQQKKFYTHTAGHNRALHSHVITTTGSFEAGTVDDRQMVLEVSTEPTTGEKRYTFPGENNLFTIEGLPLSWNDTPYWIMSAPPELIRDHSEIFTYNTIQMLRALMSMSGATDSSDRGVIVREDGVRPLELMALPDGGIAFLERSRRFFMMSEDNTRPFGLACLPAIIQPDTVIGVNYRDEKAFAIASAEVLDGKKTKNETDVLAFDFQMVGSDSLEWIEIHSDLLFTAGTLDIDNDLVYLARDGELYRADLTLKKPKPELIASFDPSISFGRMKFDQSGRRILATDEDSGSLYLIDVRRDTPIPVAAATGLGPVFDLDLASNGTSVLLLDTAGRRVLATECPRGTERCSEPEVFAAIPEFDQPFAVARATDDRVWVGDLGAQSLFVFDPEGGLVKVLDSMSGFRE